MMLPDASSLPPSASSLPVLTDGARLLFDDVADKISDPALCLRLENKPVADIRTILWREVGPLLDEFSRDNNVTGG